MTSGFQKVFHPGPRRPHDRRNKDNTGYSGILLLKVGHLGNIVSAKRGEFLVESRLRRSLHNKLREHRPILSVSAFARPASRDICSSASYRYSPHCARNPPSTGSV